MLCDATRTCGCHQRNKTNVVKTAFTLKRTERLYASAAFQDQELCLVTKTCLDLKSVRIQNRLSPSFAHKACLSHMDKGLDPMSRTEIDRLTFTYNCQSRVSFQRTTFFPSLLDLPFLSNL